MGDQLLPLPLTERSVHLCVDMQRIFSAEGPWPTPWMDRVLPVAAALANRHSRTNRLHSLHPARTLGPASNVNSEADCKNDTAPGGGMRWSQSTPPRLSPPSVECRPPLRWGPLCQLPDRLTAGIKPI